MFNTCPACGKELNEDEYFVSQDYVCESEMEITTDIDCPCGYTSSNSHIYKTYRKRVMI